MKSWMIEELEKLNKENQDFRREYLYLPIESGYEKEDFRVTKEILEPKRGVVVIYENEEDEDC